MSNGFGLHQSENMLITSEAASVYHAFNPKSFLHLRNRRSVKKRIQSEENEKTITADITDLIDGEKLELTKKHLAQSLGSWIVKIDKLPLREKTHVDTTVQKTCFSRYNLSDSDRDEEPYAADATDDEYRPDSSSTSLSSISTMFEATMASDFCNPITRLTECKKRLFVEGNRSADLDISIATNSPCSSGNDIVERLYTPEPTSEMVDEDITRSSLSSTKDAHCSNAAYFVIDLAKSWTTMTTNMVLHEGRYKCSVTKKYSVLMGFLFADIVERNHHCHLLGCEERAVVVISREVGGKEAQLSVEYCIPVGQFEGEEIFVMNKFFTSALRFRSHPFEATKSTQQSQKPTKGKKHCCFYCRRMFVEISNHYIRKHAIENEVVEILKLERNSQERNRALKFLRVRGDNHYNSQVQLTDRIPLKKLKTSTVKDCINCPTCLSLVASRNFARHERRCSGRLPNYQRVAPEARRTDWNRRSMRIISDRGKEKVINDLLTPIKADVILHEIVSDLCLQLVTVRYAYKHRNSPTALRNDRQHLRRLARLFLEIKEVDPTIIDFEDCILYSTYDNIVEAVSSMCSLSSETGVFGKPALAQALRSSISFLVESLRLHYVNQRYPTESIEFQNLKRFLELHNKNYGIYVGNLAHRNRSQNKAAKKNELPSTKDIKLFSQLISRQADEAYKLLLEKGFDYDAWLKLGKAELAKIIVFNRRRVSEVASMSLQLFRQRISLSDHKKANLTVFERALSDQYQIMTLVGKRSHILHVLLDVDQCKHLELFVQFRGSAGVPESNNYLFGVPTSGHYIDASIVLRNFSVLCGAENPRLLRTTYLRKQVATLSQLMTMNDNQIGQIATKLMGHSQKVHEQVYRQDEHLFQVTAWAKFLTIVSGDDINHYRGKTFEELLKDASELPEVEDDPSQEDHLSVGDIVDLEVQTQQQSVDDTETTCEESEQHCTDQAAEAASTSETFLLQTEKSPQAQTPKKRMKKLNNRPASRKTTPIKQTIASILQDVNKTSPKFRKKVPFRSSQIEVLRRQFSHYIKAGELAPISECNQLIAGNKELFCGRCGRDLYNWVQYQRNKYRK